MPDNRSLSLPAAGALLLAALAGPAGGREPALVPRPASLEMLPGEFRLGPATALAAGPGAGAAARSLRERLVPATGLPLPIRPAAAGGRDEIALLLDGDGSRLGREGYALEAAADRVVLRAAGQAGLFYGGLTLLQLLPPAAFGRKPAPGAEWKVPCLRLEDRPRFAWRGAMLDVSRHFFPPAYVKRFIDLIALHKLNVFHWHLTDDQGWRLEIRRFPRLTAVGAWRDETLVGHAGVGPARYDGRRHGGFYTQEEVKEIVAYAAARHVTIVPEIEMPGHAQAAIAAYPERGAAGRAVPVSTGWGVHRSLFAADEGTIRFLQEILEEVLELFPGPFVHVGGDEAVKEEWRASPAVQARIRELGLADEAALQSWFIRRLDAFLAARGRRLVGWDEILEGGLAPGATVMSWRGEEGGIAAARAGHDVVMAPTHSTYLDYYQSRRPDEPPAIGGFLPLMRVYEYDPVPAVLAEAEAAHVLGTQGQLWTEYIATPERVEYMAFPRLCALAEAAWTPKARKDASSFLARLDVHLERLRLLGGAFRPPRPEPEEVGAFGPAPAGAAPLELDLTGRFGAAGRYTVIFQQTGGRHPLAPVRWELAREGRLLAAGEAKDRAGHLGRSLLARLDLPEAPGEGEARLRAAVQGAGGSDCRGVVLLLRGE